LNVLRESALSGSHYKAYFFNLLSTTWIEATVKLPSVP